MLVPPLCTTLMSEMRPVAGSASTTTRLPTGAIGKGVLSSRSPELNAADIRLSPPLVELWLYETVPLSSAKKHHLGSKPTIFPRIPTPWQYSTCEPAENSPPSVWVVECAM